MHMTGASRRCSTLASDIYNHNMENVGTAYASRAFARKVSDIFVSFAACKGTVVLIEIVTNSGANRRVRRKGDRMVLGHGSYSA